MEIIIALLYIYYNGGLVIERFLLKIWKIFLFYFSLFCDFAVLQFAIWYPLQIQIVNLGIAAEKFFSPSPQSISYGHIDILNYREAFPMTKTSQQRSYYITFKMPLCQLHLGGKQFSWLQYRKEVSISRGQILNTLYNISIYSIHFYPSVCQLCIWYIMT